MPLRTPTPSSLRATVLCAAFALGGALAHAQSQGTSPLGANGQSTAPHTTNSQSAVSEQNKQSPTFGPAPSTSGTRTHGGAHSGAATPPATQSNMADSAFDRADRNLDGALSAAEAKTVPGLAARFQELDKDKNGTLSRNEFVPLSRP